MDDSKLQQRQISDNDNIDPRLLDEDQLYQIELPPTLIAELSAAIFPERPQGEEDVVDKASSADVTSTSTQD